MSAIIHIEGDGTSELDDSCRTAFRKLLLACGFKGRMPHLVACGSRNDAFKRFRVAHEEKEEGDFVAMLIDSEDPLNDIEKAWDHLKTRDGWDRPDGADDEQVRFMATCMETWIVADPDTLAEHYGSKFQASALPSLTDLETRHRHAIQDALAHASRSCKNAYKKGKRSFDVVAELDPAALLPGLPSFVRTLRILDANL